MLKLQGMGVDTGTLYLPESAIGGLLILEEKERNDSILIVYTFGGNIEVHIKHLQELINVLERRR